MHIFIFYVLFLCSLLHRIDAQCTQTQFQGCVPVVELVGTFPPSTTQAMADQIVAAIPAGTSSTGVVQLFSAYQSILNEILSLRLVTSLPIVGQITITLLADLCTLINTLKAGLSPELQPLLNSTELLMVYAAVKNALGDGVGPQPQSANFPPGYTSCNGPAAVRLALIPQGMVVSWQTLRPYTMTSSPTLPTVSYGTSSTSLNSMSTGTSHSYGTATFHDVLLRDLQPSTTYYYNISGDCDRRQFSFRTAPGPNDSGSHTAIVIGDMAILNAGPTHDLLLTASSSVDFLFHLGDISYADDYEYSITQPQYNNYESTWDFWQQWMSPITQQKAYMVLPGNHEAECNQLNLLLGISELCPPSQANFTAYRNRFRMPSIESGAGPVQNMWHSFDYGLVHYVFIDTETDFDQAPEGGVTLDGSLTAGPFGGSNGIPAQLDWLRSDLAKVNRTKTPWVAAGHRPMYSGVVGIYGTGIVLSVSQAFTPIFNQYKVDLYLSGHVHIYERLYPNLNNVSYPYSGNVYLNPPATTYIINGAGGNDEGETKAPSYNYTVGATYDDSNTGIGKLIAHNASCLEFQFIKSSNGQVEDRVYIVKEITKRSARNAEVAKKTAAIIEDVPEDEPYFSAASNMESNPLLGWLFGAVCVFVVLL